MIPNFLCFPSLQCVGTDRNIPDSVLRARADILNKLLKFFHGDFGMILSDLSTTCRRSLFDRLSSMFEIYLPVMIFAGNIFSTIPVLTLPKVCIFLSLLKYI